MIEVRKLARDARGATTIEYAAIASLISIVAIGAIASIGLGVNGLFSSVPSF